MNRSEAIRPGLGSWDTNHDPNGKSQIGVFRFVARRLPWGSSRRRDDEDSKAGSPIVPDPSADNSRTPKEGLASDRHIITDVLPHDPNDRKPIVTYPEIDTIMEWAEDPDVKGHIYQLESGPEDIYQDEGQRNYLYYEYYVGRRDDEGKRTLPENSTFFKAVNSRGEMIAVTTVRWKGVDFVRRGRTAYRERTIVKPEFRGRKIGLAMGIEVLDSIFYRSEKYDGLPATEVRSSTYIDRQADRHDIPHNYLTLLGFRKHGNPIEVKGRQVQPYRMSLADYEEARPIAIDHLRDEQPEWATRLEKTWPNLRASSAEILKD